MFSMKSWYLDEVDYHPISDDFPPFISHEEFIGREVGTRPIPSLENLGKNEVSMSLEE
jgi:hypothetical protein